MYVELDSTAIDHVVYYPTDGTLDVTFTGSDTYYRYCDVPQATFDGLRDPSSVGEYFHDHIADQYDTADKTVKGWAC